MSLFLILSLIGCPPAAHQEAVGVIDGDSVEDIAFLNVAVVSMLDEKVLENQTVLVQGERIRAIGPVTELPVPGGATVIDGSGRFLIPGLADMHVHVDIPFAEGPVYLDAGITTVLSLGTRSPDTDATLRAREHSRTPQFVGPSLFSVGPLIFGGSSSDEAERIVRENVEQGFDLVKVYGDLAPEAFDRLHETARELGIKVTGHAQRRRGMGPAYAHHQDIAHIEEYLYAALNPVTPGFRMARTWTLIVLVLLSITGMGRGIHSLWRRRHAVPSSDLNPNSRATWKWFGRFTFLAWMLSIGLGLVLPEPFPGVFAGQTVSVAIVGVLMLLAPAAALLFTTRAGILWRERATSPWMRTFLFMLVSAAWIHVACSAFLVPRSWRSTDAGLERIAEATAAAGIWVTPTLVVLDTNRRQNTDEFDSLNERPGMRYLKPETRRRWTDHNQYRVPEQVRPMQLAMWESWTNLLSRLIGKLNEANVPLLAGSDAVGPHGVLPGSSLHDELSLLVQAGLTPYEALRTATVNAATYLDSEHEFGTIAAGLRADLVLLAGNPLESIDHTRSRVGVMKRGRWFSVGELEAALTQLAEARQ
jgi:imidazolonepropionase-like amidohydrolase